MNFWLRFPLCSLLIIVSLNLFSLLIADSIRIGTWNIDQLGNPSRGLGGIGAGNLTCRSIQHLKDIAHLIKKYFKVDLLALQLVNEQTSAARMDANLTSIIDKILVNSSAKRRIHSSGVTKYVSPDSSTSCLAE